MINKEILGKHLKELRIQQGWTQEAFAEKCNISSVYVSQIERGVSIPSLDLVVTFSDVLDISIDSLLNHKVIGDCELSSEINELINSVPGKKFQLLDLCSAIAKLLK